VVASAVACSSYSSTDAAKTAPPPEDAGHSLPDSGAGEDAGSEVAAPDAAAPAGDADTCDGSLAPDCKESTVVCLNACAVKAKQCHTDCGNSTPCNNLCDTVDDDCVKTCINGCLKCDSKNCAAPTACKALAN
jgi:hypothetical protein